jgi:hypothetical protein
MLFWAIIPGALLILIVLWDAFETIVLPRRVTRRVRLARLFYRYTWLSWSTLVRSMTSGRRQETYLSYYGPLSLLLLLCVWATGLITGFAILQWGAGSGINSPDGPVGFTKDFYLSGTTFFTLGLGDITPRTPFARILTAVEAGMGFGFLALVIGYLPLLNQSFSRREVNISLLDARAGSPPTAAEMLRRHSHDHGMESLRQVLYEWERWSAEFLEIHLSYPVLAYFRSQHDNQSWLTCLTTIMDTSALVISGLEGVSMPQAQLTFAMARHAVVDLSQVFHSPPGKPEHDRLPPSDLAHLREFLAENGIRLGQGTAVDQRLTELRNLYEPYVYSLSRYMCISLPQWISERSYVDNWETSTWERKSGHKKVITPGTFRDEHF